MMKIRDSILLAIFIISISAASCSPQSMKSDKDQTAETGSKKYSSKDLLTSYKANAVTETAGRLPSPIEKETDGLRYILEPYFNKDNDLFIGYENKKFLESNLLENQYPYLPVSAENLERILQIIFSFNDSDKQVLKTYINEFSKVDKIERQYAVYIIMKLLPSKYPVYVDGSSCNLQKSEVISDLDDIDGNCQELVRQAFCLGFTDFSVEKNLHFRPFDSLNNAETISMLYRILSNLGLPASNQSEEPGGRQMPADNENLSENAPFAFSIESILLEYNEYKAALEKSNKSSGKKRLDMLKSAEEIIGIHLNKYHTIDTPLDIVQWEKILSQVFGLEPTDFALSLDKETDGALSYDIAAISIMTSSRELLGYDPRDATDKELEEARESIPQFDTARDTDKFAQMFSSGLLDGLYCIPGFTPQRPVSEIEALLIVKRIIEDFKLK